MSESALRDAADWIAIDFGHVLVRGVVDDFTDHLSVPRTARPRLVAFLGDTLGNLLPAERAAFFASCMCSTGSWARPSRSRRSVTTPCGTPHRSGSTCGCGNSRRTPWPP